MVCQTCSQHRIGKKVNVIWQGQPSHSGLHKELEVGYWLAVHDFDDGKRFNSASKAHAQLSHDTHAVWNTRFQIDKSKIND